MSHVTTATKLRLARVEAGLTQPQLAELTGIRQANLSRYENGQVAPNATQVDRILTACADRMRSEGKEAMAVAAIEGTLGIVGRSEGKLGQVADLMAVPQPKEWLAGGLLAKRYVTMVAGQEGAGKSTVTQSLAVALANGHSEAFGFRLPGKQMRGLVIDVENVMMVDEEAIDGSLVQERLQRFGLLAECSDNLTVVGAAGFDLDKDSQVIDAILTDAAADGQPYDFVILDSFRSLWVSGSENTPDAGRVCTKINRLAFKHNVGILVIHHTNKAGAAYSGHTSIGSTVAAVWTFSRLIHKNEETGKKEQHPTARYFAPYKVRIAAEAKARIVAVGAHGITSQLSADAIEGFGIDEGEGESE